MSAVKFKKKENLRPVFTFLSTFDQEDNKLDKKQEMELWRIIKNSKNSKAIQDAQVKITSAQYPLLSYLAKKRTGNHAEREELIAVGLEVCIAKFGSFDPARKCRFSTFIVAYVKKAMDTYHKQVVNSGITYYPKAGYAVLELDENFYKYEPVSLQLSENERIMLLEKLSTLDTEEQELIERHYFKREKLIDIAREKVETAGGDKPVLLRALYPDNSSATGNRDTVKKLIKKEHDRIRQRLHRAEKKLEKIIIKEGGLCTITR